MLKKTQAVLLAAGKSTRFQTGNSKLVEKVCGQHLINYPIDVLEQLKLNTTVVLGHQAQTVKEAIEYKRPTCNNIQFVIQDTQKGTADAVLRTKNMLSQDLVLILKGDMPLITQEALENLYQKHVETNAVLSFIWTHNSDPTSFPYSRVIKENNKPYIKPVDAFSKHELADHCCITTGIYLVNRSFLIEAIEQISFDEANQEYALSDLINIASDKDLKVTMVSTSFDNVRSIKTFQDLWAVEQIKRSELIKFWMKRGVRFHAAQSVHIDLDVQIGSGTFIGCSVHLEHGTQIGTNCHIEPFSILDSVSIENNVTVHSHSILRHAHIGSNSQIGPFAHIQEETTIGHNSYIGNFVETKRTQLGDYSKAKHLSYLGDAQIGSYVNIGAGTITCNYDGKNKQQTVIKDHAFIGTNNSLVAPVTIHSNSFTAAGSTITQDVPQETLAIGRAKQVNKIDHFKKTPEEPKEQEKKTLSFVAAQKDQGNNTTL